MSERKINPIRRLLKIEPGISLTQWAWDKIPETWRTPITGSVVGAGMSYLASITDWVQSWGPLGYGIIALLSAVVVFISISLFRYLMAGAAVRRATASATEKWKNIANTINPLDNEFSKKRIKLADLSHPMLVSVDNKTFVDCDLMGPANMFFSGSTNLSQVVFFNCDIIVAKESVRVMNVIPLNNINMYRGRIVGCTIYITSDRVAEFQSMGTNIVSFTGVAEDKK